MGDSTWGTASSWIWLVFLCHSPWCLPSKGEGERPKKENIIFKSLEVCEITVHQSFFTSGLQSSNPCSEHRFWGQAFFFFFNYYLSLLLKAACQLFQKHVSCSTGRWEMSGHCCIQGGNGRKLGSLKCVPSFGRVEPSRDSRAPCHSRQALSVGLLSGFLALPFHCLPRIQKMFPDTFRVISWLPRERKCGGIGRLPGCVWACSQIPEEDSLAFAVCL